MIETKTFEVEVIKTSEDIVKSDTCTMVGGLDHHGKEVKVKIEASSEDKVVLEELFDHVGCTVTFKIVENAQTTLIDD